MKQSFFNYDLLSPTNSDLMDGTVKARQICIEQKRFMADKL